MAIPKHIKIKGNELPASPGVYFMKDAEGQLLYIGKATSLKSRVGSYFVRPSDQRIAKMVTLIGQIDYEETPTAIEALLLETRLIKKHQPPYNVMSKDDKSWVYLVFTRGDYPTPELIRGHEFARMPKRRFLKVFGPFKSAAAVRASLDTLRKTFPWTTCRPDRKRPCFYRHLKLCPGVCTGDISQEAYMDIIKGLMKFFEGKRSSVVKDMEKEMKRAAKDERYEDAGDLRDRLYALSHIRDIAILKKEDAVHDEFIDIFGRIEGYDISNISGQDAVGSMVVFRDGEASKGSYRKFIIKEIEGPNDVAMMQEMLRRRFARSFVKKDSKERAWPLPDLVLVDGGIPQVNVAKKVLEEFKLKIPLVGIAKGPDRKQDVLVYDKRDLELRRLVRACKPILQQLRDEAHRFAVSFHRKRRGKRFLK